ncbi:hypothetical protein GCM10010503_51960 [Streptomyces lucensis JCM 4490]|uniref:Uncharacterized protein n=1 Tax=Streptomyces lucensis JCM 4490 TaxID=1306176 RepID=A0A918MUN3_9ACTN|nr:hypothetical protein GCM10010503_51960 [Streptomyces lucensis JCM 4490]
MPNVAQTSPHTLSQNRARSALRAVTGSLPVRIGSPLLLETYSPMRAGINRTGAHLPAARRPGQEWFPFRTGQLERVNAGRLGTAVR